MDKYKAILISKMKNQFTKWFVDDSHIGSIPNQEVYRFLHSIKGTSGTLQLDVIYKIATDLLQKVIHRSADWKKEELHAFLTNLMEICEEYDALVEMSSFQQERNINVPLIQLIDDDISLLIFLKDKLESKGWMVIANTNAKKAIEQFYSIHPDCIIIDINLPEKTGFDVLKDIQKHTNRSYIPKIICSNTTDRFTRISAYKMGADDYMEKPLDVEEFLVRVERHLERKKLFDQSVLIDDLTQVYNRKFLQDSFRRFLSEINRTRMTGTIAILDLDYFKKVNDTYGHVVGDKVLSTFAQFLKNNIRHSDTLFRYGGEEFVILFQRATEIEMKKVLERMIESFSKEVFVEDNHTFSLTFSAGIYRIESTDISLSSALKAADEALYVAKQNGRARVECAKKLHTSSKKTLNISIVDDDTLMRSILIDTVGGLSFEHLEINVQAFEDGVPFLESNRLEEEGMHFLILDGVMPNMDGLELLSIVKHSFQKQNVHVLMLTSRNSEKDIATALKLGADDYMTKPFSKRELQARITRLLMRMIP